MKPVLILVFLAFNCSVAAQSIEMQKGQPFPFDSGLALQRTTADSTRNYVKKLQQDYLIEISRSRECEFKLGILQMSNSTQSVGYEGLQAQYATMKLQYDRCQKVKRRRFWIGLGVGFVGSTLGYIAIQN